MSKLISNLFRLFSLALVIATVIVLLTPHNPNHYMAAALDKFNALHSAKSPRIILVGGSNVAFSIDSEKIEKRFGVPVINMGLHAGVGLRFMLTEIKTSLGDGDIVILSPEYTHLQGDLNGTPEALANVVKYCFECASGLDTPSDIFNATKGFFQLAESDMIKALGIIRWGTNDELYSREKFNQRGDYIGHLKLPGVKLDGFIRPIDVSSYGPSLQFLNSYYLSRKPGSVRIFYMFPGIRTRDYLAQEENFTLAYNTLKEKLDIPILGTPQDFTFPDDYFYDTVYHMSAIGRDKRTDRIIELLSTVIED